MRRIGFATLFILILSSIQGQITMRNESLISPEVPIAYRGLDNKITFVGVKIGKRHTLRNRIGDVYKAYGPYFLYKGAPQKKDTLYLYKGKKLLHTAIIDLQNLKTASVFLGRIRDSIVTIPEILSNNELILSHEPQLAKPCSRVLAFDFELIYTSGDTLTLPKRKEYDELLKNENLIDSLWHRFLNSSGEEELISAKLDSLYGYPECSGNQFTIHGLSLIEELCPGDKLRLVFAKISCSDCIQRTYFVNKTFLIKE